MQEHTNFGLELGGKWKRHTAMYFTTNTYIVYRIKSYICILSTNWVTYYRRKNDDLHYELEHENGFRNTQSKQALK